MAEVLRQDSGFAFKCSKLVEETSLEIRGYLFKNGVLVGIYSDEGLIPVESELPFDINEKLFSGKIKGILKVLIFEEREGTGIEIYFFDGLRKWLIYKQSIL
ncbi:MAG: hypothetical protein H0Z18_08925 [Thermococcus sp.]|uniref:hypothetical protein n=1 Tax=Thermococcus sp. TaxID=35749 RepID=UPI001D57E121|nr:hypothetical protein [Thermococcus sp.]MBO8175366.1 hypothetical protein [Thermococcus sp.]